MDSNDYAWIVRGVGPLHGPWDGWRLAGRDLVSPDGLRINARRVAGLAWRQDQERRLAAAIARNAPPEQLVRVVVVRLNEWKAQNASAA